MMDLRGDNYDSPFSNGKNPEKNIYNVQRNNGEIAAPKLTREDIELVFFPTPLNVQDFNTVSRMYADFIVAVMQKETKDLHNSPGILDFRFEDSDRHAIRENNIREALYKVRGVHRWANLTPTVEECVDVEVGKYFAPISIERVARYTAMKFPYLVGTTKINIRCIEVTVDGEDNRSLLLDQIDEMIDAYESQEKSYTNAMSIFTALALNVLVQFNYDILPYSKDHRSRRVFYDRVFPAFYVAQTLPQAIAQNLIVPPRVVVETKGTPAYDMLIGGVCVDRHVIGAVAKRFSMTM